MKLVSACQIEHHYSHCQLIAKWRGGFVWPRLFSVNVCLIYVEQKQTAFIMGSFTPLCTRSFEFRIHAAYCIGFNSPPPRATYMRQWIGSALVQIMACRLFSAKPLSKPMPCYVNLGLRNKLQWNFNQNTKLFIHRNASENIVCEMVAILSRRKWIKLPREGRWQTTHAFWYPLQFPTSQLPVSEYTFHDYCWAWYRR